MKTVKEGEREREREREREGERDVSILSLMNDNLYSTWICKVTVFVVGTETHTTARLRLSEAH